MSDNGSLLTVRVPLTIRRRGSVRKTVAAPGVLAAPMRQDITLVKAVARAFRWRRMLESGCHSTVAEVAAAEKINESYVCRLLRLTLLAPDIVESILEGKQATETQLSALMQSIEVEWREQRCRILGTTANQKPLGTRLPMSLSRLSSDAEQNHADHRDDAG